MKLLAGLVLVVAQALGLGGQISPNFHNRLTNQITNSSPTSQSLTARPNLRPVALPVRTGNTTLTIGAASAIAVDATTMQVLYAKDAGTRRPIASITKLATALVLLSQHDPDETVIIPDLPTYGSDDAVIGLRAGESFRLYDLVQALLIPSAGDAADGLAVWDAGSATAFTAKMNAMMRRWQIDDMHFSNASGIVDHDNYATATSLARLGQLALASTAIKQTVSLRQTNITNAAGKVYSLQTTNDLLANSSYHGIKTGYTVAAGGCFMGLATINGHEVITVVLGANDRFAETRAMTNWIGNNWQWL